MDEHEANELLGALNAGVRTPTAVRERVWAKVEETLTEDVYAGVFDLASGPTDQPASQELLVTPGIEPDLIVALESDSATRFDRRVVAGFLAAAAVVVVALLVVSTRGDDPETVFADVPLGTVLADPDAACARFRDEPFDHGLYLGESVPAGSLDTTMLLTAERAFAQLRVDLEASDNTSRVVELLGLGKTDGLGRVEALFRQARLQTEQGNEGSARRTLQAIPDVSTPFTQPGAAGDSSFCLGS